MSIHRTLASVVVSAAACALFLGGCSSSSKAEKSTESMAATGSRVDQASGQVDTVLASLENVVNNKKGDLKPAYDRFSKEVDKTMDVAAETRRANDNLKSQAAAQFDAWIKEAQNLSDPNLQKASLERRDEARSTYTKIQDSGQKAKAAYDPFINDLKDIRSFLHTDLTAHGVDATAKTVEKVKTDGAALKAALGEMKQHMSEFKAQISTPSMR
jgi:Protein of unknown function (DUF2959)